jgi:Ca2+-binding RTX toxin-like protein
MPANALSITDFGAKTSAADNTAAIQKAINAARAQNKDVWVPKGEYKHGAVLKLDGVKIYGEGDSSALIGTNRANWAIMVGGDGAEVSNLRLESSAGPRLSSYESTAITVMKATNFVLKDLSIEHSGIHITGSSRGLVENNIIKNTAADSIHMSNQRGANQNITVRGNDIDHPHDDGVAVVSYGGTRSTHPASHHITIENNSVTNQEWGRGYTVVGGHDVTIRENFYNNNISGAAGIYIASEPAYQTLPVTNITVADNLIKNAGGAKHASIQIYSGNGPVSNVLIDGNAIYASKAGSILTNGSSGGSNITIKDNVSYGPAKGLTDFVGQLNNAKTIESNNKIFPKASYPGDGAYDVGPVGAGSPPATPPVKPEIPIEQPKPTDPVTVPGTVKYEPGVWWKVDPAAKVVSGTAASEAVKGSDSSDVINGKGGDDTMAGLKGHDTYHVDSLGDKIVEQSGHGNDIARLTISKFTLPANVENATIVISASATLIGNGLDNWLVGNIGNDVINGGAGKDRLTGNAGNDTFVFAKGQLNGDQITDFKGNGAAVGDVLRFEGFGSEIKLTHDADIWTVTGASGSETFRLIGVTSLDGSDFQFV